MIEVIGNKIDKEILEIECTNIETATRVETELREILNSEVPDLILDSYKKYFNSEISLRIEKLFLDLGEIELSGLKQNFLELFSERIDKKFSDISRQLNEQPPSTQEDPVKSTTESHSDINYFQKELPKEVKSFDKETDSFQLLKNYFLNGMLPWWATNNVELPVENLLFELLKKQKTETALLLTEIFHNKFSLQRFAQNFSTEKVSDILYQIIESVEYPYKNILLELKQSSTNNYAAQIVSLFLCISFVLQRESKISIITLLREYFTICKDAGITLHGASLQNLFYKIFESQKIPSSKLSDSEISQILTLLLEIAAQRNFNFPGIFTTVILTSDIRLLNNLTELQFTSPSLFEDLKSMQRKYLDSLIELYNSSGSTEEFKTKLKAGKTPYTDTKQRINISTKPTEPHIPIEQTVVKLADILENKFASLRETTIIDKKNIEVSDNLKPDIEIEKFYIENAGLCLVAPFLPAFFKKLEYIKDGSFISVEIQKRASHLLQCIVDPSAEIGEHRMLLNKLLCGIPFEMPLLKNFHLQKYELEEIELMLNSVIQNWSALKNTSVEGFRSSFILRNGVLSLNETQWTLMLERKPYDVILETLPWNISIIKLKWMNKLINVEW